MFSEGKSGEAHIEGAELDSIEEQKHLHYCWECALQYTVSNQTTFLTNETIFKAY